jgi:alkylresorcinol/alkylpyrone synthase
MRVRPKLLSLATAVPENVLPQETVLEHARAVYGPLREDFDRLAMVFVNTGIDRRYSVAPLEWLLAPQDWPSRTAAYVKGAGVLFCEVARAALDQAGLGAGDIDTVITISTTGIATPSLDARVLPGLGFRPDVRRVPVFGVGCAGGVTGLSLAARLAAAEPGTNVLVVAVELCTLSLRIDLSDTTSIVATALFGDGAAGAVVSSRAGDGLAELGAFGEHTWPGTLRIMGWEVDPVGFGAVLSKSVPQFVLRELPPVADAFLSRNDLKLGDIANPVFHPGGSKVVDALEQAFHLGAGALHRERAVLRDYGNMSSPTVLFILRRAFDQAIRGRGLLSALGPGFTASFLTFEA